MDQDLQMIFMRLEERFDGRQLLTPADLANVLGRRTKTVYNKISAGTLGIPMTGKKRRPRARLIDVARFLRGIETE